MKQIFYILNFQHYDTHTNLDHRKKKTWKIIY